MLNRKNFKKLSILLLALLLCFSLSSSLFLPVHAEEKKDEKAEEKVEVTEEASEEEANPYEGSDFADWDEVLEKAKGSSVTFYGWGGSDIINAWIDDYLAPYAKEHYEIELERVPMDIDMILNKLAGEKSADKDESSIDLIWINGENFATAKENDFLYGPFTELLPNFREFVDAEAEENIVDFAIEIEGMEAPYSRAQLVLTMDTEIVKDAPKSAAELLDYLKENPGTFTYAAMPDFTSSAFVRNIVHELCDYEALMEVDKDIEKAELKEMIQDALDYLNEIAPYLWEEGKTYPATTAEVDQMFMDGLLHFSMSYDQNHAATMIKQELYPETASALVFDKGTVGNTSFVAIGKNSKNIAGALALADAILSPEMQASKTDPEKWGTLPVLDFSRLSEEDKALFDEIEMGEGALDADELLEKRVPELPAYLIPMIEELWEEEVATAK